MTKDDLINAMLNGTMEVSIITSNWCTYCTKAKELLNDNNIPFVEKDINDCIDIMAEMELKMVPQIFVGNALVEGGYSGLKELLGVK